MERRALMLRLESMRLMGLVTTGAWLVTSPLGLLNTASSPTLAGSEEVMEWRRGSLEERIWPPWDVSLTARPAVAAGFPAGFAQGLCKCAGVCSIRVK